MSCVNGDVGDRKRTGRISGTFLVARRHDGPAHATLKGARGSMQYECVQLETAADAVATLTLMRPDVLNAWNDTMEREIQHALRRCDQDDAVRCVVVTGAGRAFCAGADLTAGRDRFRDRPEELEADAFHPWVCASP